MKKKVKIGLVGFGTVGSGVYNVVRNNADVMHDRSGVELSVASICDLRLDELKQQVGSEVRLTDKWKDLIDDPEIDTIVELIGGIEPAKTIILEALKAGKNVVTANKKLLAEAGEEIFEIATNSTAKLGFEAAVAGGIPCINDLKNGLVANQVKSVMGILNGTTNYILTRMEHEGLSFDECLKEAQDEGFAETDPTFDIEGYDAGHKIALLAMLAFNKKVLYKDIEIEGITKIEPIDTEFARSQGYALKLLGIAKNVDGKIDVRVHPAMIRETDQLAAVSYEFNAVVFDNDMTGEVLLYGKGAGSLPTASAVVSDIVQIAVRSEIQESAIVTNGQAELLPANERRSRYYLRMHTSDQTGILEKVAHSFAHNDISIASVVQLESDTGVVPLLFVTHEAVESGVKAALDEINNFEFIKEPVMMIRIED